jgi:uncharacterized protein (TIGR00369 family)
MDSDALLAAGWESISVEGFTGIVGPFWRRETDTEIEIGLIVRPDHCNSHLGTLHGGVIMTFADIALGSGAAKLLGEARSRAVTASLQTHFVSVAMVGEFVSCKPEVVHQGKQMFFVRGLIRTDQKVIASADGIWKLLG